MMKKLSKKIITMVLALTMAIVPAAGVMADGTEDDYSSQEGGAAASSSDVYVSFGADLSSDQKSTVMDLLGVKEEDLADYAVGQITNDEEHEYLDSYLSADVIGKHALSSVKVMLKDKGNGINVETYNINYCTKGMYTNALITAGIQDADVVVAGPFNISGTAALIGAMKAYAAMTGTDISEDSMDAAVNELVTTGEVAQSIGDSDDAEQLFALVKEKIVEEGLTSPEDISKAIDEAANQLEINLSDEDRQMILDLMQKIAGLDLDLDTMLNQAKDIYNKLDSLNIDTDGFMAKLSSLIDKIINWFNSIAG